MTEAFFTRGWTRFGADARVRDWLATARPAAQQVLDDPAAALGWRCGGTWFAGVDALPNDAEGRIGDGPPLAGAAVDFIRETLGLAPLWHAGQLSVTRPGYPQPWDGEGEAAFRFRLRRDAAHVDGILPIGPERRRMIREPHAFILGLPVTEAATDAAPLVVWEGSHDILRRAFRAALADHPRDAWPEVDVTDIYARARREVFDTCPRVPLPSAPGEAILLHRLTLHGVAPWAEGATADPMGRAIAYFRPEMPGGIGAWLDCP